MCVHVREVRQTCCSIPVEHRFGSQEYLDCLHVEVNGLLVGWVKMQPVLHIPGKKQVRCMSHGGKQVNGCEQEGG